MSLQSFKKHPLALSLQIGLWLSPTTVFAAQLIANTAMGDAPTASGTYDTGTASGRLGHALIAEDGGFISSAGTITAITGGANAYGVLSHDFGNVALDGAGVTTTGTGSHGLHAQDFGRISFSNGKITTRGSDAHGVVALTIGAEQQGIVTLKNSEIETTSGSILQAEGVKSRISAEGLLAKTSATTSTYAAVSAQLGGTITVNDSVIESAFDKPLLQASGAGSSITLGGTKADAHHQGTTAGLAWKGGAITLKEGTTLTSGGIGLVASGEGSRASANNSTIVAKAGPGAEAQQKGLVELTNGSVTGLSGGLRAVGEGSVAKAVGTTITATGASNAGRSVFGATATEAGLLVLGEGTKVKGDNGVAAVGGRVQMTGAQVEAPTTERDFIWARGVGVVVSPGGEVEMTDTTVTADNTALLYSRGSGAPAKVLVDGGSLDSASAPAVLLDAGSPGGAIGELRLGNAATLKGVDDRLIEVRRRGSLPAELRVFADQVALAGNLLADAGAVLDLSLANASSLRGKVANGGAFALDAASRWDVAGTSDVGTLRNAGAVAFVGPEQGGFKTLTVHGDYVGEGGTLAFNTVLAGDDAATDRLVVEGNTSGQTSITVNNIGGAGAQTVNGIGLVRVGGNSDGVFALSGRAVAGAYDYRLFKGGVSTPQDGGWYLRSQTEPPVVPVDPVTPVDPGNPTTPVAPVTPGTPTPPVAPTTPPQLGQPAKPPVGVPPTPLYRPEAGAYLANQAAAIGLFQHQMHDRMGEPDFARGGSERAPAAWTRVVRHQMDGHAGFDQLDVSSDTSLLQVGGELAMWMAGDNRFHFGAMAAAGRADNHVDSALSGYRAKGKVRGYAGGLYATWFGSAGTQGGPYADAWVQYGRFNNQVSGDWLARESYDASSWSASLEGGYTFAMPSGEDFAWFIEPQLQAIYTDYDADRHVEANGTVVGSSLAGQLTTRVGVRVFGNAGPASRYNLVQPFVLLNWWRNDQRNDLSMDSTQVLLGWPRDRYEAKLGAQLQLGGGWTGWGNAAWQTGSDGFRDIGGQLGVNYRW